MIDLEILKQQAKDAADAIADKSVELYKAAEGKTKALAKKGKLTAEITALNRDLKKLYTELGEAFYNTQKDAPDEQYQQLFTEIAYVVEQLGIKQTEFDSVGAKAEDDDVIEVDPIISKAEDVIDEAKDVAQDAADAVKDAAQDAVDAVEDAVDGD